MWNSNGKGGGGFFDSPKQFDNPNTPSTKAKGSNSKQRQIAPIVIAEALQCSGNGFKIWGNDIELVCVVARVLDIQIQSTKIVYHLEDISGKMTAAMLHTQSDEMDDSDNSIPDVMVNTYAKFFGKVTISNSKILLAVIKILNITNVNEITNHYLKSVHHKLYMENKANGMKTMAQPSYTNMPENSMMMDMGSANTGLNPRQSLVFNLIRSSKIEQGIGRIDMSTTLKDKMSKAELDKILDWMCGEGHIYSTIDDDHFRATDAS